jgi:hypothetical protein
LWSARPGAFFSPFPGILFSSGFIIAPTQTGAGSKRCFSARKRFGP